MDELRELWKYAYAWASFRDAIVYSNEIALNFETLSMTLHKSLAISAIIAYARPFKQKSAVRLCDRLVPMEWAELHSMLLLMRDKVVTHQDPNTPKAEFGHLTRVTMELNGEDWEFATLHPGLTRQKCLEIMQLAGSLQAKCGIETERYISQLRTQQDISDGKYCIEPNDEGSFSLRRIEG